MKKFKGLLEWVFIKTIKYLIATGLVVVITFVIVDSYYKERRDELFFDAMNYVKESVKSQYDEKLKEYGVFEVEDVETSTTSYI